MRRKPTLVLISGAPGTGKTVLAQQLAAALPVTVIEKDVLKENLFDTLGERDLGWSKRLGAAAFALLDMFVQSHLKAGQSVIAEAAFWREPGIVWLDRMKQRYNFRIQKTALGGYGVRASSDSIDLVDMMCRLRRMAPGSMPSARPSICGRCSIGRSIGFLAAAAACGW